MARRLSQDGKIKDSTAGEPAATSRSAVQQALLEEFVRHLTEAKGAEYGLDVAYIHRTYDRLFPEDANLSERAVLSTYLDHVGAEKLDPNRFFSEAGYLDDNPDVAAEIEAGAFFCGYDHWLRYGRLERRDGWRKRIRAVAVVPPEATEAKPVVRTAPSAAGIDADSRAERSARGSGRASTGEGRGNIATPASGGSRPTPEQQTLVQEFVRHLAEAKGAEYGIDIGYIHETYDRLFPENSKLSERAVLSTYLDNVAAEKLDPNRFFSEAGYLDDNPDVVSEIKAGAFVCGYDHWLQYGRRERRGGWQRRVRPVAVAASATPQQKAAPQPGRPLSSFDLSKGLEKLNGKEIVSILRESGVYDAEAYLSWNPDLAQAKIDPLVHYVRFGAAEGRLLHPFFDQNYYLRANPGLREQRVLPILHYLFVGAKEGRNPHAMLDTAAYAKRHGLDLADTNPLIHINQSPSKEKLLEAPLFDRDFYVSRHPDSAESPAGPLVHFLHFGVYSGYSPSEAFNTRYYYARHLNNDFRQNAYTHYIEHGRREGLDTQPSQEASTTHREIARFTAPGTEFEDLDPSIARGKAKRARVMAFYLPQFHAIEENDAWWGKGFTEWRNLQRGAPRFVGHYQPRMPRDLSYYDLSDPSVMKRQVQMALEMGLGGFCFYFYWFNRHRLLEKPLEHFLEDESLDIPFMLIWANENWTRRWDGAEDQILIKQDHKPEDDEALVDCLQRHFADKRYLRVGGRPLLVVYRAAVIPSSKETLARWRKLFLARHGEKPLIFMAQAFGALDPEDYGFDGAIEFPPHKIGSTVPEINRDLQFLDWDYEGSVRRYTDAIEISLGEPAPDFPLIKTVFPSWDNNSRRPTGGMVFQGSTPALFQKWLDGAIAFAEKAPVNGEKIVFINAWNEWCEAAYLEPDVHYGGAMLNSVARVVTRRPAGHCGPKKKLLLVGHDAFPAGAQRLLLALTKLYAQRFGLDIEVLLLGDGDLVEAYRAVAPTTLGSWYSIERKLNELHEAGYTVALCNTLVSAGILEHLTEAGFDATCLVHELPSLIRQQRLEANADLLKNWAEDVVFPSEFVRDAFYEQFGTLNIPSHIIPQGIYSEEKPQGGSGADLRTQLGVPRGSKIVLNVAYGDMRKGLDLFCQVAIQAQHDRLPLHFVWVGAIHPDLRGWLVDDLQRKQIARISFLGERDDVSSLMKAADIFFLTSREDPFPSVVLEALRAGLPVVAYENNGGYQDLIAADPRLGLLVPQGDVQAAIAAIETHAEIDRNGDADKDHRAGMVRSRFDFARYGFELLKLQYKGLKKVSVVVPNYNYAGYIRARLASIFDQTYPLYEIIILDDASTDPSLAEIEDALAAAGRVAEVIVSDSNSGDVFHQWRKGCERASGDLVWIAEADDVAEPTFLERLIEKHSEDSQRLFTFCDSRAIDSDGFEISDSYLSYVRRFAPGLLDGDVELDGIEFVRKGFGVANPILNASSVLWDRTVLMEALDASAQSEKKLDLARDWLLYVRAANRPGSVAYVADSLNIHRRHEKSVTHSMAIEAHLDEIKYMQSYVGRLCGNGRSLATAQGRYLKEVTDWLTQRITADA